MNAEQIEQKKQLLAEKVKEMKAIHDELVEAGAIELSEEALNQAAGGRERCPYYEWVMKATKDVQDWFAFEKEIDDWVKRVEEASGPHPETSGAWCY